jgi:plasmid stabilization system protein ParE
VTARFDPAAQAEAEQAARGYERRQAGLGEQLLDALTEALETIQATPAAFERFEAPGLTREVRQYTMRRFPYVIVYEPRPDEVLVVAVAHSRQRPGYWLDRLPDGNGG